jgi:hypothetical protein
VGNNKGIKSVFFGHSVNSCCGAVKQGRSNRKHKLAKSDLRDTGKVVFYYLLEDLQRVD